VRSFDVHFRWLRPSGETVLPEAFVDTATELGIIVPLGLHVLRTACTHLVTWLHDGTMPEPLPIGFNVSSRDVQSGDYPERLAEILRQTRLPPSLLAIELEDRVFRDSSPELDRFITAIIDLGVRLMIVDFGGGYSSWSQLQRYTVSRVKLDCNVTAEADASAVNAEILRVVTALAAHLNVPATAVGIDSERVAELARAAGCDRAQGPLFSEPVKADFVPSLLSGNTRSLPS